MIFLPIVTRELRVAARRRSTYALRSSAALTVMLLGTGCFLVISDRPAKDVAMTLFCVLTGIAVCYGLLSGVFATADCLSEEKREGTLGLLFLTDLKGYDVVLGKLVASSLNSFYSVLAVVPMLAIPLLMGGITAGEFGRMALVAVNTLFFSLTLGIGVSALSRSALRAGTVTFLLLLFFTALLPACGLVWAELRQTWPVAPAFLLTSAVSSFWLALDAAYRTSAGQFWDSVFVIHGMAWFFLLLACVLAPRAWAERAPGAARLSWHECWKSWSFGNAAERAAFRHYLLDQNAFFWLAGRSRLKPACVWAVLGLLACAWVLGLVKVGREWLTEPTISIITALILNLLLRIWWAMEATAQLAEERKAGTLELLLATPLSVRDILRGQALALQRQFLAPVGAVLAVEVLFMVAGMSIGDLDGSLWVAFWVALMLMLLADLAALYYVGMWQGLTASSPLRGVGGALVRLFLLPWVAIALVALMVPLISILPGLEPAVSEKFFLTLWFAAGIAADIGFGGAARRKLLTQFRWTAAQRYDRPRGFWKRLLGKAPGREWKGCE